MEGEKEKPESGSAERPIGVSRRTYLGAVAGSVIATPTTVAATDVDIGQANWSKKGKVHTYRDMRFKLTDVFVQNSVSYHSTPDSVHIRDSDGLQYVFANLQFERADTTRPPITSLSLIADGKQYNAGTVVDGVPLFAITDNYPEKMGETYHSKPMTPPKSAVRTPPRYKNPTFTVGFAVPSNISANRYGVGVVPDHQAEVVWEFDRGTIESLETSPQYELISVKTPDQITRDESFEIGVSVKNTGERPGTYRAVLGRTESNHKKEVTVPVSPGEQQRETANFRYPPVTHPELSKEIVEYQLVRNNEVLFESEIPVEVQ